MSGCSYITVVCIFITKIIACSTTNAFYDAGHHADGRSPVVQVFTVAKPFSLKHVEPLRKSILGSSSILPSDHRIGHCQHIVEITGKLGSAVGDSIEPRVVKDCVGHAVHVQSHVPHFDDNLSLR